MRGPMKWMVLVFSMLLIVSSAGAWASGGAMTFKGELMSVNPDTHTMAVKDSKGNEWMFTYNDSTQISGEINTVEGLAGKTGTPVTVHYREEGGKKIATRVEVHSEVKSY